jgi:hypothetical protein
MVRKNGLQAKTGFTILRRRKVTETEARLLAHEAVCAERYASTNARLKRIEKIMIATGGSIIALLLTLVTRAH